MARTQIAADDFNRADGGLGANWTSVNPNWGDGSIVSNEVVGGAGSVNGSGAANVWSGAGTFSTSQYSKATLANVAWQTSDFWGGVIVRATTDTNANRDYYGLIVEEDTATGQTTRLYKIVNGTYTSLDTDTSNNWVSGDTIELEAVGVNPTTFTCYRNGTEISGLSGNSDSDLDTGKPGITNSGGTDGPHINAWEGGDVTSASGTTGGMASGGRLTRGVLNGSLVG